MIVNFSCDPYQVTTSANFFCELPEEKDQFPLAVVGADSYIVSSQIQSGINFDIAAGCHNLIMGKYCSVADRVSFMIDLDHDYKNITTGCCSFLKGYNMPRRMRRKGQIIIQNDVWIGHEATILGGVCIGNGAIIASNAVITKDVPPYAIVAGNPARIVKYRFSEDQISKLNTIAWWNWDDAKLRKHSRDFKYDIDKFISLHYENALAEKNSLVFSYSSDKPVILFIPDFGEPYPIYKRVISEYRQYCANEHKYLLALYMPNELLSNQDSDEIERLLKGIDSADIKVLTNPLSDERLLFADADCFIPTRSIKNISYIGYAGQFGVKFISGVDVPVFGAQV